MRTKSVVLLRMYPSRYPSRELLDVALLFGEERNNEVAALSQGDWVEFEATMTAHGYRGDPEVMTLWHIANTTRPSPLSSSPGSHGSHNGSNESEFGFNATPSSLDVHVLLGE